MLCQGPNVYAKTHLLDSGAEQSETSDCTTVAPEASHGGLFAKLKHPPSSVAPS